MATSRIPGLVLTDHEFEVPLDHSNPTGEQITVFSREVVAPGRENDDLPYLLFLQGGPGFPSPRPESSSGWIKRALQDHRILLLDQRGTGRSAPVNYQTLAQFESGQAQADYLTHFRADSIVLDSEMIRQQLLGEHKWSVLGQSYGGFCIATYLSIAPEGVKEAIFTGGLPPVGQPVDDIYRATYRCVIEQNQRYYDRYPGDVARVREVVDFLSHNPAELPGGGILSPRRFQQLGAIFGSRNGFETLHYLLEEPFVPGAQGVELNLSFLRGIEELQSYETNPIYALLHEPIYCEGFASNWSAERVLAEYPEFSLQKDGPVLFTGEMIYPWMFDEYRFLQPLKEAAEILAAYEEWPQLYDLDQLRNNIVPCVATVYYDDMYVERGFSEETARLIKGTHIWVTNEYVHSGLRLSGERILDRLLSMLRGEI